MHGQIARSGTDTQGQWPCAGRENRDVDEHTYRAERRKDRSPYGDEAVGKFLDTVRLDCGLDALVVADAGGYLVAASSDTLSDAALAALGSFGADVKSRLMPPAREAPFGLPPSVDERGAAAVRVYALTPLELILVVLGETDIGETQVSRIRSGIQRILKLDRGAGGP